MLRNILTIICLLYSVPTLSQEFTTIQYFSEDTLNLKLDLFLPKNLQVNAKHPLVIFVHGGGFSGGNRSAGHKLAEHLASQDIACASITYTLYMKDKNFSCDGILSEKVKAIQIAANQLWKATSFFIENASRYNIDTEKIFIAGSSAGAETVLHAAYWDRDVMKVFNHQLTSDFRYTGIIAGAGAIMDLNVITKETVLPSMVFHGDRDKAVPYGTAAHHYCPHNAPGWLMLFGSKSIAEHSQSLGAPFVIVTEEGGGHGFAGYYFKNDQKEVSDFVKRVLAGESFSEWRTVKAKP